MRIVVSGTHASGKSTLISDFALRHPGFIVLPDPFEAIDEEWDAPGAGMFVAQLRIATERLRSDEFGVRFIAERGPLDFLAYLIALAELGRGPDPEELIDRETSRVASAMHRVELLAVLPLAPRDRIEVGADEDPALRQAMNDALLDLVDDPDLVGGARVVEITGDPATRLAALESAATL